MFGLFKTKIANENRDKPFFKNRDQAEQIDWLKRTRGWHELSPALTEALVERFNMSPMFEVFIISSMETGLVGKYADFCRYKGRDLDPEVTMAAMSGWLQEAGNKAVQELAQHLQRQDERRAMVANQTAANAFDASLALDEDQLGAYLGKALLAGVLGRDDERIAAAEQGLAKVAQLADARRAMAMSSLGVAEGFDRLADALRDLASPRPNFLQ